MQIVWFRRDLRLSDCEIIHEAAKNQQDILPCFIIDPWFFRQKEIGAARVKFLLESLDNLNTNLVKRGSRLYLFNGESVPIIEALTRSLIQLGKKPKLYFNRDVQVSYGIERDREILELYSQLNLETHIGLNHFLQTEQECYESLWQDYHYYQNQPLHPTPELINTPNLSLNLPQLTFQELKQKYWHYWQVKSSYFVGGEDRALATLNSFLSHRFWGYHWKMSRPWEAQQGASSHLSPHLCFGTISTRIVFQRTRKLIEEIQEPKTRKGFALKAFLDRLRWHDKFTQRLYYHPELATQNPDPEFDRYHSGNDLTGEKQELFWAWCNGITGFPMVDASMRQLNQMGWMNFRMRAMCATFLTINCGVSWQHGACYFMTRLVDGDIAINHRQWQMQSGVTNPMSKTFRIYNPSKNLQEKDPNLQFVLYWIPELRGHSMKQILSGEYLPNISYPKPVVDWKKTRSVNGKVISNLRSKVRDRLERERGEEYYQAIQAKETVEKYFAVKDKQYQDLNNDLS
ncbi:FAD-binding domain-containing protein [Pleurocapsa sp. PCC 7319]|uniref:FAD-binding domain-containing protein n=1 Tax=Pleurocapsa sp. PCC 7319 TaxID=118161 RepID=UPI00034C9558|nr:FAD-binding domain-containing protein [Pleurocapsa sp. PCC 7319]